MALSSRSTGVFPAHRKNGELYYRSSITYRQKHISLGSFDKETEAHHAYQEASALLHSVPAITLETYSGSGTLSFEKWVCLLNYRDNGLYIKNPIYLRKHYFEYYYAPDEIYLFDIDDLFYYSEHKIMKRNGHLFVGEYGFQTTILSRYGIKNYAVAGRDYQFKNGNPHDLRYENIQVINPYYGVTRIVCKGREQFRAKIHVRGSYIIGIYETAIEAAIAYNKAIDILKAAGSQKNYQPNYIETLTGRQYAELYSRLTISPKLQRLTF